MWTRKDLKNKGLIFYRKYFLTSILVCLLLSLTGGIFNYSKNSSPDNLNTNVEEVKTGPSGTYYYYYVPFSGTDKAFKSNSLNSVPALSNFYPNNKVLKVLTTNGFKFSVSRNILFILTFVGLMGKIFIYNPLSIGLVRYFTNGNRDLEKEQKFSVIFSPFADGTWAGLGVKLLVRDIFIFLWTLLLIIPGIVKSYQYYYVPYILSDDPDLKITEAIDISKEMTSEDKFNIFVLNLSFLGWEILSLFTFGIGFLFLNPYMESTYANLYLTVNEKYTENSAQVAV